MGRITVSLIDSTGNKNQEATLPDDVAIRRIMSKLVEKMALPAFGHDGQPMSYKFIHKASGRQLLDDQTLCESNVQEGDVLRMQAEIVAGARG